MLVLCWVIFVSGAYPVWRAWRALRHTSLVHAWGWEAVAWLAWGSALLPVGDGSAWQTQALHYVALCLLGCAGVAVLGARRPGVAAWDFVVLGLLATLLLFLAEGLLVGSALQLGPVRTAFLVVTLAVGVGNYLPTRFAPAALAAGCGCGIELWRLTNRLGEDGGVAWGVVLVLAVPWIAMASGWLSVACEDEYDRMWRAFRDRFGLIWALRLREQFNRAAANAGLAVELGWGGLRPAPGTPAPDAARRSQCLEILQALLKRFGPEPTA